MIWVLKLLKIAIYCYIWPEQEHFQLRLIHFLTTHHNNKHLLENLEESGYGLKHGKQIRRRFEREAAALATFEPTLSLNLWLMISLSLRSITHDILQIEKMNFRSLVEIIKYRTNQFYGSYKGSKASKEYLDTMRREYFYPTQKPDV